MEELDFEPLRVGMAPQETLLVFGVRPIPTAIVLTKDAHYDPVRDAKTLLFTLTNGLDPQTFQHFCEMVASMYLHNLSGAMEAMEPSRPTMKKVPNWTGKKRNNRARKEETFEDDEVQETDQ